ncbi:MAG: hypothetical protein ABJF01_04155 [bacterium]
MRRRPGRAGAQGSTGAVGLAPRTTTVPLPIIWTNSPIWSDPTAQHALLDYNK